MNKNRHPMEKGRRKKMSKAIREAQGVYFKKDSLQKSDTISADEWIKIYPKHLRKKDESLIQSMKKGMQIKKNKKLSPHSKRTTPGEVVGKPSAPAHVHSESKRWEKTLVLQNDSKRKLINRKLSRHK